MLARLFRAERRHRDFHAARRRPRRVATGFEALEQRRVLNSDTGWIKIDLSQLDQTGVTPAYDIYIQGSANTSGQILQYDPTLVTPEGTGGLVFTTPLPSPVTFTSANYTPVSGDSKSITLSTAAEIFAGGSVKFSGGATSTIASITANVTVGNWTPPASAGPGGTWNPFPSSQVTGNPNVVIQSGSFSGSGTLDGPTLTGANGPAVSISGMSIGSLVVGTIPGVSPTPNTYFFPNSDGQPFHTAKGPAQVTQIGPNSQSSGDVDVTFSETSSQSTALGSDFLTVFSGGTNSGFATYVGAASQTTPIPASLGGGSVQQVTLGNLLSTSQVQPTDLSGFNPHSTLAQGNQPQPKSFLVVDGFAGTFPIYEIESFTITFAEAVPANTSSITFETTVAATATSATTFTIDAGSSGIPGIIAGLSLGLQPTLSQTEQSTRALSITELAIDDSNIITVTLAGNMPWSSGAMSVDLPPTGGFLPTTKWSATDAKSNTIWARQTSAGSTSNPKISVNGSRIYFSLVAQDAQPPQMPYAQGSAGFSVTQFKPEDIWNGIVPLSQYLELTADALPRNGDGLVYLDLSAVDGFFFPAALSTTVNNNNLVIGQASGTYVPPTTTTGPTTYSAVSRQEILNAYDNFFAKPNPLFASTASALQQAYAGLHVKPNGTSIGIQNPTFIDWSTPFSPAATALNAAWDNDLDALFTTTSNQVNLLGDKNSTAWSVVNAIQVGRQGSGYAVDDVITFTAPSSGGRAATAKVTQVQPSTAMNPGGIVQVAITDSGVYPSGETPTVQSILGSGGGATLNVVAMVAAATFYKGVAKAAAGTASGSNPNTLVLTEYVGPSVISAGQFAPPANFAYANLYATGAVFTVFDPRTVPASETQAFNPGTNGGQPTPMAVGQQILGNSGVFASTTLNTTGSNPNYSFTGTGTDPWPSGDALAQLDALQRDIVWALNQGNGGIPAALTNPEPGSTTAYWTNETNWYPYPHISQSGTYQAQTPQNLFAQWVHTAGSAGVPALGTDKYFATFPFGNDYGQPTKAWGPRGAGTGPLMNQTYGFAYDESPAHGIAGANVPSKFLPIPNAAGETLTFQLVFGPWEGPTPSAPTVVSLDTRPPQARPGTPTPTAPGTVTWNVLFNEPVTGVSAANFALVASAGLTGSGNIQVTPSSTASAAAWTVTANTGTGSGTLGLNLTNVASIKDASGHALAAGFTGQVYAVSDAPVGPTASIAIPANAQNPTSAATVTFDVTFSQPVTGLLAANFAPIATGGVTGLTVGPVTGSGTSYTVTVNTGSGSGTLALQLLAPGTGIAPTPSGLPVTSAAYTIRQTPVAPALQSISRNLPNPTDQPQASWTVSFSEAVAGVTAGNFSLVSTGLSGAKVTQVVQAPGTGTGWTVTALTGSGVGTLRLDMVNANGITDTEGLSPTGIPLQGQSYDVVRGDVPGVRIPIAFWAEPGRRANLVWPRGLVPFTGPAARELTVTLAATGGDGSFAARRDIRGITVAGTGTGPEISLTGTARNLNAYFRTAGRIGYTPSGESLLPRVLAVSAVTTTDTLAGFDTAAILVRGRTSPGRPTIAPQIRLGPTPTDTPLEITYETLLAAANVPAAATRSVEFLLGRVSTGRLEIWDGAEYRVVVPRLPRFASRFEQPLLAPGGRIKWTPRTGQTGEVPAFTLRVWDGRLKSADVSQVFVDVTAG